MPGCSLLFDLDRLDEMEKEAQAGLQWAALAGDEALMAPGRLCWGQVCWRRGEFEAAVEQLQRFTAARTAHADFGGNRARLEKLRGEIIA